VARAARDLIEEQGFEALTMRALAARADVSVGTVQNVVGSRVHLVVELFVDDLEAAWAGQEATLPAGPLLERLLHLHVGFFRLYAARPALARTYVKEAVFSPEEAFRRYLDLTVRFVARLAALIVESGELRAEVPPPLAAQIVFDTYLGAVIFLLRQEQPDAPAAAEALRARLADTLAVLRPLEPSSGSGS
jgi:AcrR family transcriptional regulator